MNKYKYFNGKASDAIISLSILKNSLNEMSLVYFDKSIGRSRHILDLVQSGAYNTKYMIQSCTTWGIS